MPDSRPQTPPTRGWTGAQVRYRVCVWADLTCPWCYLGRYRLNRAVAAFEHPRDVTIRQNPCQTDAELPPRGNLSVREGMLRRVGDPARVDAELARALAALTEAELPVDLDRAVAANTFDAHRVVELAWRLGGGALQSAVVERLMAAHFAEGLVLDDPSVLVRLGPEAGLEERAIMMLLAGSDLTDVVQDAGIEAAALRIERLPVVIVDGGHRLDGTPSVESLLALLHQSPGHPAPEPSPTAGS